MTSQMRKVSQTFADRPDLKFVSITVDPVRDTPTALAAYARQFHADPARWVFLTGAQPELQKLSRNVFMLGDVDGSLEHSTRFVLVDRQGRIRGFYLTSEPGAIDQLNGDIRTLFKEKS
jgi:protein SCO1